MRTSRIVRIITTAVVLGTFTFYFVLNHQKFRPLLHINLLFLVFLALGNIVSIFINGLFTKFILKPFNKTIPLAESFYVSLISSVGNFFAPVGAGFGFRAIYLKKRFGLPYSEYTSTLAGNYIFIFLVNSFFALLALYLLRAHHSSQYGLLVLIFSVIFLVSLLLSLFKLPVPDKQKIKNPYVKNVVSVLYRIMHGWNHIISHKKLMVQLMGLTFTGLALNIIMSFLIIHSIHLNIAAAPLLLFSVLSSLSLFINITPANLGVKEAIYLFSSAILGFTVPQILSIALIDRGVLFLVLLLAWASSSRMRRVPASELISSLAD